MRCKGVSWFLIFSCIFFIHIKGINAAPKRQKVSVAEYLDIEQITAVPIRIPVHVVYIGPSEHEFPLDRNDMAEFFPHLAHSARHTFLPLVDGRILRDDFPPLPYTEYEYDFVAWKAPWDAASVLADYISLWMRRDDAEGVYYVSPHKMSSLLEDYLEFVGMPDVPVIIVMKPDVSSAVDLPTTTSGIMKKYGYRSGFSKNECNDFDEVNMEKCVIDDVKPAVGRPKSVPNENLFERKSREWSGKHAEIIASKSLVLDRVKSIHDYAAERTKKLLSRACEDDCLVDSWVARNRRLMWVDLSAGPWTWGRGVGGMGSKNEHSFPHSVHIDKPSTEEEENEPGDLSLEKKREREDARVLEILEAKHSKLRKFYSEKCLGRTRSLISEFDRDQCQALDPVFSGGKSYSERVQMIGDVILGGEHEVERQDSWFLASLGSSLVSAVKHVITPSTPAVHTHSHKEVRMKIIQISVSGDDVLFDQIDTDHISSEMKRLFLPSQEFVISVRKLHLSDAPTLASAFHSSLNAIVAPLVDRDGVLIRRQVLSLDSQMFQYLMDETALVGSGGGMNNGMPPETSHLVEDFVSPIELPVFVFSSSKSSFPLLIDGKYPAKALSKMVLAVQSPFSSYQTHLSCDNHMIRINLHDPTDRILSSSALFIGGLAPTHLRFDIVTKNVTVDYRWSAGASPLSHYCAGSSFSRLQIDSIMRNSLVFGIEDIVDSMNAASALVESIPPLVPAHVARILESLSFAHKSALSALNDVANAISHSEFAKANALLLLAEEKVSLYQDGVDILLAWCSITDTFHRQIDVLSSVNERSAGIGRGGGGGMRGGYYNSRRIERDCSNEVIGPGSPWIAYTLLAFIGFVIIALIFLDFATRNAKRKKGTKIN